MSTFTFGLDLGQANDYTALAVVERLTLWELFELQLQSGLREGDMEGGFVRRVTEHPNDTELHCRHCGRLDLGTPYPRVVERVRELLDTPPLRRRCRLVVDITGVGRPVFDMLRKEGLSPVGVTITGGDTVTCEGGVYRVPKRDLAACVQVLLQQGRLRIAEELPEAQMLVTELLNFRVKIDPLTAHDSYAAWREGIHDDLVLALALACWYAETRGGPVQTGPNPFYP